MPGMGGSGGPAGMPGKGGPGVGAPGFGGDPLSAVNSDLIAFLKANASESKYQVAMFGGLSAAPYITNTDLSVLPIGGFSGSDPTPTVGEFEKLVMSAQLKYVLAGGMGGMGGGMGGMGSGGTTTETASSQIDTWVSSYCQTVDYLSSASSNSSDQGNSTGMPSFFGDDQNPVLYKCKVD